MSSYSSVDEHKHADVKELESLLDAFGSMFSLEDISSAYWEANRDVNLTGELLFTQRPGLNNDSDEVESAISASMDLPHKAEILISTLSEQSNDTSFASNNGNKGKKFSVSTGLVPGVIGKDYARTEQPTRPLETTKPVKLHLNDFLTTDKGLENKSDNHGVNKMHKEVEDFLFQMLGYGFQFDMNVIRSVLGQCGYDVKKGMEKLLDLSASTLEKSDDVIGAGASNPTGPRQIDMEYSVAQRSHRDGISAKAANRTQSLKRNNNVHGLEKEVLQALFSAPGLDEQKPEYCPLSRRRPSSRSGAFGTPVAARPEIINNFRRTVTMDSKIIDGDSEVSFEVLRQAVKEYWVTMKEYYKAAFEAFSNGDLVRANKLLEQGHFFNEKAKEADAKSAEMLFRARDEDMSLDLRDYKPSEAIRLIRSHLTTVAGIPTIEYLKLRIGTEAEDKKGARRRRILQELEAESIKWTGEQNDEIISIRVDGIDPKRFSFAKAK
ncbi:unnamed protein product [Rhodiola kirilowii]